jgi:Vitamin K-dependent gamma-carboxylase
MASDKTTPSPPAPDPIADDDSVPPATEPPGTAGLFQRIYMTADLRSLAAGRIAMSLVLLLDLFKRWVQIDTWYTNEGLIPNHTLLWRPSFDHEFSLFFACSYTSQAMVGFFLCFVAYLFLLVGYRTRLAQIAACFCLLNLHGRLLLFDNGGDVVLGLLCVWTTFLPTGRRFSIDALLTKRRPPAQRPRETFALTPDGKSVVSLGVMALMAQLALIYFFNAIHKGGRNWMEGTAVHYVFHLDRLVTTLGVWMRDKLSLWQIKALTYGALGIEWSLPYLLLSPLAVRWSRRIAILFVIQLHIGFALFMNLGNFVPAMISYTPNFLTGADWDALEAWWARKPSRVALSRRLEDRIWAAVQWVSARFSWGRETRQVSEPGRLVRALHRSQRKLREALVVGTIFLATNQLFDENHAAHRLWDHHNSPTVRAAIMTLNLFQGWAMFAPEVFTGDLSVSVDALTVDGRHVDPLAEESTPRYPFPGGTIPTRMGENWLFYQYAQRIVYSPAYYQALTEWILRYPQRTGRPADEIVSFTVYKVEDDSPPPGELEARNARTTILIKYPH